MTALKLIVGIVYFIVCIALIIVVMLQESKSESIGAISGGIDSVFGKGKTQTKESFLNRLTVVFSIAFAVLAVVFGIIVKLS